MGGRRVTAKWAWGLQKARASEESRTVNVAFHGASSNAWLVLSRRDRRVCALAAPPAETARSQTDMQCTYRSRELTRHKLAQRSRISASSDLYDARDSLPVDVRVSRPGRLEALVVEGALRGKGSGLGGSARGGSSTRGRTQGRYGR